MNPNENTQIVRIKDGSIIGQDHSVARWPRCWPPRSEYGDGENPRRAKDPDMLFCAKFKGKLWECVADGYGDLSGEGDYGSGRIFVFSYDGVEIVG
jgi:hypothetical protein